MHLSLLHSQNFGEFSFISSGNLLNYNSSKRRTNLVGMKLYYYLLLITLLSFTFNSRNTYSQTIVCLGSDDTVCVGNSIIIQDCLLGGIGGLVLNNPTYVTLSDDSWSPAVNIGFSFSFYGNTYSQCTIGSNGLISFNMSNANGYCPWALGAAGTLPNTGFAAARNSQMPAYHDINPSVWASPGGLIFYETIGSAPNRQFIVVYSNIMAYGGGGECTYMAVVMSETSNTFEFHLGYKPIAAGWNGGLAIQGSENDAGTVAHITPGRNNSQWSALQEAKMWTPTSPSNTSAYTISNTPYLLMLSPGSSYNWENTLNQSFPYNNGSLLVNSVSPGAVGYFLTVSAQSCNNSIGGNSDTTWIVGSTSSVTASMTDDICSAGLGTVTATPTGGTAPFTYLWPGLGNAITQNVTGVFAGTYTVEMTDSKGCVSTANVTVGDTPANFQGTTTLVSCPGGSDGTATAEMVPVLGNVTYLWDNGQITQTAVGLSAGQYTCTVTSDIGCNGTVVLDVTEIPGMIGNIANQTDVTCNSGDDGMIEINVIQGTPPYTYSWNNSVSTLNIANDLVVGAHECTITDFNGCVITVNGILGEPPALDITSLTPDTQICPEEDITLSVTGSGGSSTYTFTWYEAGTLIGTGMSIIVDPEFTNTEYCVVLSELCGSPVDQECLTIYFPTPILPAAVPDEVKKCVPNDFEFTNTSTNPAEIATTFWEFGDNATHNAMEIGADSTSHYYDAVGTHTITMTVTSIFGCVYTDTLFDLIEVLASPTADFNFSDNPATIFETVISMQDKSSPNVIYWDWLSPYSTPSTSSSTNPVFIFPEGVVATYPVTLIVETEQGCMDTTTYYLDVVEDILFFAPNAFTPDGDEFNQIWKPSIQGIDIYDFDLFIFNRWGEIIWENHDPSVGWDGSYHGKFVQEGTYTWIATVKSPYVDDRVEFSGCITILK